MQYTIERILNGFIVSAYSETYVRSSFYAATLDAAFQYIREALCG